MQHYYSFDEYQTLALRTLNDKGPDMNLVHCAMGMSGEAAELYGIILSTPSVLNEDSGMIGELGDCAWYAAVAAHYLGVKFSTVMEAAHDNNGLIGRGMPSMLLMSGELVEMTKKHLFYGKPIDTPAYHRALVGYCSGLLTFSFAVNVTMEDLCFRNINKLQARYPDKFESDRAINRDYEAESKAAGVTIV